LNLQQLYYFRTIAKLENYTKAAKELMVSQPSLCRSMAALEEELGAPLFKKTGRNIKLTQYGVTYFPYINRAISEIEMGKNAVQEMLHATSGRVRLAFMDTLSTHFIPGIVSKFYKAEANNLIKFDFAQLPTLAMAEALKNDTIDLGFGAFVKDDALSMYFIMDEEIKAVVSKNNPLSAKDSIDIEELADEEIITYKDSGTTWKFVDSIFKKAGVTPKIALEVDSNMAMAGAISENLGVGLMINMFGIELYDVKTLHISNIENRRPVYMYWRKDEFMLPPVKRFRDYVVGDVCKLL